MQIFLGKCAQKSLMLLPIMEPRGFVMKFEALGENGVKFDFTPTFIIFLQRTLA